MRIFEDMFTKENWKITIIAVVVGVFTILFTMNWIATAIVGGMVWYGLVAKFGKHEPQG
jgi:hypothetical protein